MSNRKIDNLREPSNVHFKVQTGYPGALDAKEGTLTLRYISGTGLCLFAFHANKWNMIKLAPMNAKDETIVENLVVKNLEVDKTAKFKSSKIDVSDKNLPEIKKWNKSYDDLRSGEVDAKFKKAKVSNKLSSKDIDCSNNLMLGSEDSNVLIKNDSGVLKVRSADDTADAKVHAKYVQVTGEVDTEENTLAYSSSFGPVMRANGFALEGYTIPAATNGYEVVCATSSSSSTITCDSANTNIKVGHIPTGTGIPSGKLCYVGAITESGGAGTGVTSFVLHQDGSAVNATATNDPVTLTFQTATSSQLKILSHDHHSTLAFVTTGTNNPWAIGVDIRESTHGVNPSDAPFVISKGTNDDQIHSEKKVIIDTSGNVNLTENLLLTSTPGETTTMSVADSSGIFTIATAASGGADTANIVLDSVGDIELNAATGIIGIKKGATVFASFGSTGDLFLENSLNVHKHAYFDSAQTGAVNSTSEAAAINIDWAAGNKYHLTVTHTANTVNFSNNPDGPCNLILKVIQGNGSDTIGTWAVTDAAGGAFKWPAGAAPVLSTGSGDEDIIAFYYDGTNYYGSIMRDFS